jgi:hypothetical protein
MATPKHKPESNQREKFEQLARELGCDESEEAFKAAVKKIATATKAPVEKKP